MDIHKPKPWHGLREFLKEYAIIVLGVLTAIAFEQTVEIIHRQDERKELQESLQFETDQILRDTVRVEKSDYSGIIWEKQIGNILAVAHNSHQPLGNFPPAPKSDFDVPDDPIYRAAQSSGKLTLLSKDEREVYSEMNVLIENIAAAYVQREEALMAAIETQHQIRFDQLNGSGIASKDFSLSGGYEALVGSTLSSSDLRTLFDDTVRLELKRSRFVYWSRQARGAAAALKRGERKLRTIQAAERQFDALP